MNIKSAKYIKNFKVEDGKEVILEPIAITVNYEDGSIWDVPMSEDNTDYEKILKQVKEGTLTIADAD